MGFAGDVQLTVLVFWTVRTTIDEIEVDEEARAAWWGPRLLERQPLIEAVLQKRARIHPEDLSAGDHTVQRALERPNDPGGVPQGMSRLMDSRSLWPRNKYCFAWGPRREASWKAWNTPLGRLRLLIASQDRSYLGFKVRWYVGTLQFLFGKGKTAL